MEPSRELFPPTRLAYASRFLGIPREFVLNTLVPRMLQYTMTTNSSMPRSEYEQGLSLSARGVSDTAWTCRTNTSFLRQRQIYSASFIISSQRCKVRTYSNSS
ncbi:hypothetical protein PILCRDRAFT_101222 [Piloderma croceum F 1598]|uniref:Uncharacterized protein n=1 Tax=Piloderma croceum (strain F 1598) TaxID=765440 RepID=A0A0C3GJN6_PILCF|nr:hypothetical protein PILCRDRAFT_101222 [Piloderma croceum F 1598]